MKTKWIALLFLPLLNGIAQAQFQRSDQPNLKIENGYLRYQTGTQPWRTANLVRSIGPGFSLSPDGVLSVTAVGVAGTVDWNAVSNKPASFVPATHTHALGDINGLVSALSAKQATLTGTGDVPGLNSILSTKQTTLVSGNNIATINGYNLLTGGDIVISAGGSAVTTNASSLTAGTLDAARLPATAVQTTGSYANPSWLTALAATKVTGLAAVATSGSFADLIGKPTIPTSTTNLINDSDFRSGAQVNTAINNATANLKVNVDTTGNFLNVTNGSLTFNSTPIASLSTALATKEPAISAGTASQVWRGNKTFGTITSATVSDFTAAARLAFPTSGTGYTYDPSTGLFTITASGGGGGSSSSASDGFTVNKLGSNTYVTAMSIFAAANTGAGNNTQIKYGVADAYRNAADWRFHYEGNGSGDNRVDFTMSGFGDPFFSYNGRGHLLVNTTSDNNNTLQVQGTVWSSGSVFVGNSELTSAKIDQLSSSSYVLQTRLQNVAATSGTNLNVTHNFGANTGIDRIVGYESGSRVSVDIPFDTSSVNDSQLTLIPAATTTYTAIIITGHKLQ